MTEKLFLEKKKIFQGWKFRFWKKNDQFGDEKSFFGFKTRIFGRLRAFLPILRQTTSKLTAGVGKVRRIQNRGNDANPNGPCR